MGTGIGCQVLADGRLLLDGSVDPGASPVVLSGLEIAWGRDTTVDQPEASTCTFDIDDPAGGSTFADRLRTGTRIDVLASGTIYPDPTEPVWPDPGFETGLPGMTRSNAVVDRSTRRASSGQYSARMRPVDPARRATTVFAPAPFSPPGTAPDAWDDIPTTSPGQTWSYGASVFAPAGAVVQVRPVLFTGPYAGTGTVIDRPLTAIGTGTGVIAATRTNLVPNPSFEGATGTSGWSVGGGGAVATTAFMTRMWGGEGAGEQLMQATADGSMAYLTLTQNTGTAQPVTPGQWVAVAGLIAHDTTGVQGIRMDAVCYGTATTYHGSGPFLPSGFYSGRREVFAFQVPETADRALVRVQMFSGSTGTVIPAGKRMWCDSMIMCAAATRAEAMSAVASYFDGDTPDTETTTYAWTGEPNASTSIAATGGASEWATLTGTFTPNIEGAWVGLQVTSYPTGRAWDELSADLTWDQFDPTWQWDDFGAVFVDDVTVLAPAEGTASTVLVYSGRVVALELGWDDGPVVSVSCADFTADMENVDVGEEPWTVEAMGSRFQRIVDATGMAVTAEIDTSVAGILVSWRDVDAAAATGLLAELAESVDAVMWSATHQVTGPYLRVEDPTNRPAGFWLQLGDGVVTIVPNPGADGALELSACDVLRDDVTWSQDVQDVITRAAVSWQEQGVDDEGQTQTTERTVTLIDTALEAEHGVRRLSLSTQLQSEADALDVAEKLLARTSVNDWRAEGLVVDDDELDDATDEDVTRMLTLLDGTSRNGLALALSDLPTWSPAGGTVPVYLEGGKYTFEDGRWLLDLTVSNTTGQGSSAQWDELDPTWTWDQFDPAITWDDLRGVGVAPEGA